MVYLSHYVVYPIFEAAEGGYYYEGVQLTSSTRLSKRAAKSKFKAIWKDCKEENLELYGREEPDVNETNYDRIYPWVWFNKGRYHINKNSYYIGEGEFYVLERKQGKYEKGYRPYC